MEDKKIENVLKMVISKAWEDVNFRKNLITDPVNVIEKLTGAKVIIPEGKELIFIDQTDKSKVFVNIPSEPDYEDIELSEEQLEVIAGGGRDKMWGELVRDMFPSFKNYIKF